MSSTESPTPRLFGDHFLASLTPEEQSTLARMRLLCREFFCPNAALVARQDGLASANPFVLAAVVIVGTACRRS